MMILYSAKNHKDLNKISSSDISLLTYAQTSRILNLEVKHIKARLRNVYLISKSDIVNLLAIPPMPTYIKSDIVLWEDMFALRVDSLNWESLNLIIGLSGSLSNLDIYKEIVNMNLDIKQDMMYLNIQLQEISARINSFTSKKSKHKYFDIILARQILRKKKIRSSINKGRLIIDLPNVKIGNQEEGYVIYNNIYIYISKWNSIDGYILQFNNFSFSSFWNIKDVVLHPYLFEPYYIGMPYLDVSLEAYLDNLLCVAKGEDYGKNEHHITIDNIIKDYNVYRRIWNGIKDPRLEASMESYKEIFVKKIL